MKYYSTKTFGHDIGLSCCFRQWKAPSHCNLLHGYSISVHLVFACEQLDYRNWVMDFGACKPIKQFLETNFDHTTLVGEDDPHLSTFRSLSEQGLLALRVIPAVGCEKFAEYIAEWVSAYLKESTNGSVSLVKVEVREHGANSAFVVL